jgi:hypothetical protein
MNKLILSLLLLASSLFASLSDTQVPEPSTYLMMAAGVGALAIARYRKSKKK